MIVFSIIPYFIPLNNNSLSKIMKENPKKTWANVGEISLYYERYLPETERKKGNILMIHGFAGSTYSWQKNVKNLQNLGYEVILVDLPAFGLSDRKNMKNHSPSSRAKLLWNFVSNNFIDNQDKWIIFGHSMGASVALAMAQQKPSKVENLFLVDGANLRFGKKTWGTFFTLHLLSYPPLRRWIAVIAEYNYYNEPYFKKLLASAYQTEPTPEAVKNYLMPFKIEGTTEGILQSFLNGQEKNPIDDFSSLKMPIYLLWGTKDTWVPIEVAKNFIKNNNTNAKLITLENAGHNPMETQTEKFNNIIKDILEKN